MNTRKLSLFMLLAALPLGNAIATTWIVTGTGEPATIGSTACDGSFNCPTLRDAINSVGPNDVIQFSNVIDGSTILLSQFSNAQTGTEFGPSAFFISGGMSFTIDGETGLTRGITIARDPSQAPFRLFDIDTNNGLTLQGLTLKNGLAQGFSSTAGGGALGAGGAIFNRGLVTINQCTFANNAAQGGASGAGGGGLSGAGVGSAPSGLNGGGPNGSTTYGVAGGFGGGGIAYDSGSSGGFGGGGGSGGIGGDGGFGGGAGGASAGGSTATGGFGGGGNNGSSYGGGGAGMGGAIFNDAGTITIVNSTFTANSASGGVGGPGGAAGGSGFGGAIFNYSAALTIQFATLARNSVVAASGGTADGGALYSLDDRNCNSGGNTCPNGSASTLTLEDSIFSNSPGGVHDISVNVGSPPATGTFDGLIVMSYDNTQFTTTNFKGSADPQLSPLGYHGGWTPVLVPHQGSTAIDAFATCPARAPTDDQRGLIRPYPSGGKCDVGAVEYDGDYIFANSFD